MTLLFRQYCTRNTCKVYGQAGMHAHTSGDNALLTRFSAQKQRVFAREKGHYAQCPFYMQSFCSNLGN